MITQLEVFTPGITEPPLPIVDQSPALDQIQIKKITGLDPVTASVNTLPYGSIDGEYLTGTHTPKRNIVITAMLRPDWSRGLGYEDIRQILYLYFMPGSTVRMRFTSTHLSPVEIEGVVESCDLDMFSKDSEYQISILCPQPYFVAVDATVISGVTQGFTGAVDVPVDYEGTEDAGFIVDVSVASGSFTGEIRVINNTPTTKISSIANVAISTSQFFRMSSVQGDKYIRTYPLPSGDPTNIMGSLATYSEWVTLRKGVNNVRILSATPGLNFSLSYYAKYGGL